MVPSSVNVAKAGFYEGGGERNGVIFHLGVSFVSFHISVHKTFSYYFYIVFTLSLNLFTFFW